MENCKISGKNQGILRWMISGYPEVYYVMGKELSGELSCTQTDLVCEW